MKNRYIIPVNSKTKEEALKSLHELMKQYQETIVWEDNPSVIAEKKRKERKKKLDRIFNEK